MVATEEEGETQMVVKTNRIKDKKLYFYNRKAIIMVVHLRISSLPGNMVQLAPYNATNVMNGDTFQIIYIKFLLIVSVAEAVDVVEVHALAEDPALECYRFALVLLRTLME